VCKFLSFCSDGNGNYYYSDWKLRKKILKCYIDLHRKGFVPSFDGTTWRLHAGKDAKIVFEISKEKLESFK